jgi:hypothetical protein
MSKYKRRVHIQNEQFPSISLCGHPWENSRGGRVASSTEPPAVIDEETGSVNAATCDTCLLRWRRLRGKPSTTT